MRRQALPLALVLLFAFLGFAEAQLDGLNLRIVTVPQAPFVYYDASKTGNDAYTGYYIDFWNLLALRLSQNFTWAFYNSPDGKFGGLSPDGNWTGMIKEILDGNADLAVADFTITSVTAWTVAFENIGLAVMVPANKSRGRIFKFLDPFSPGLWVALLALSVAVSVSMWVSDRLSPYGWSKQAKRKDRMNLSYPNSLLASLMLFLGNGNMMLGRSWGTRILQLAYIAFAVITVANYTANLAATYTAQQVSYSVGSFSDLARGSDRFGVMNGTSAQQYIRTFFPAQELNMVVYNNQTQLVTDLRNNKLVAYVNDKDLLEFIANQPPCNLFVVGGVFNPATFGIAMPQVGFEPIRQRLSTEILSIVESGQMATLHNRWFSAGACSTLPTVGTVTQLGTGDFAGVFALVAIGLAVCLCIIIIEWIFVKSYKRCHTSKAAKEMSDFFGGEAEDPIARWRAHSFRGIFSPPPKELAHRRHIKKHAMHPDADRIDHTLIVPENPLVDLHLASTIQARTSLNQAAAPPAQGGYVSAPLAASVIAQPPPAPPASQPAADSPMKSGNAAGVPDVAMVPAANAAPAAAAPNPAPAAPADAASAVAAAPAVAPAAPAAAPASPAAAPASPAASAPAGNADWASSSGSSSPAPAAAVSPLIVPISQSRSPSRSASTSPPGTLTAPALLGTSNLAPASAGPASPPGPERRARLLSGGARDLPPVAVASPPPPRRQRITASSVSKPAPDTI